MEEKQSDTYFSQLKKQMTGTGGNLKADEAYKKEQEILKKIEEEKELPAAKKEKELFVSKEVKLESEINISKETKIEAPLEPKKEESALEQLKKISGKKEDTNPKEKTEKKKIDFSSPLSSKNEIVWTDNKTVEAKTEREFKQEFVESKPEMKMQEDGKKLGFEEKTAVNTGKSIVDYAFFEEHKQPTELDWLKREIIEAPQVKDFPITQNMEEKQSATETQTPKELQNSNKTQNTKEIQDAPEKKENEIVSEKEEVPKEKTQGPRWLARKENITTQTEEKGIDNKNNDDKTEGEKSTEQKNLGEKDGEQISSKEKNPEEKSLDSASSSEIAADKESENLAAPKWATQKKSLTSEETKKFHTSIDEMFEKLEAYQQTELKNLAEFAAINELEAESILKVFEDDDIVQITYPTSLSKGPVVMLKNPLKSKVVEKPKGKLLDDYSITIDHVPANISIIISPEENRPTYCIDLPAIGKYTKKFLDFVKNEIAEGTLIELEEILDPKKSLKLKERFFDESRKHLEKYFPRAGKDTLDMLSGVIMHEMYGLGDIEILVGDDQLEEIAINSAKTPITVYHRIHGWLKTNLFPGSEDEINNYASQIGRKVGREITTLSPILDAHLLTGDRVNATLFPVSAEGNTITIRRFARKPWTLIDFIGKSHTMNAEMAALLWLAIQYEMNIVIAGGTASGKTSALNTLLALVPSYHRIISIEDVREIVLPKYLDWNWIPMITRSANPEGLGEVTMLELMVSSLRMRPDRIIVGEIRRKKEAEVLMEAIETGHSIYSTIHANSAYQVLRRLAEPPMSIPLMQIELIDLIVVQFRDRKTNKRRTYELAEIEQTSTGKGLQINTLYKWVPRTDTWEKLNKPNKILTMLNLHTGLTEDEINLELKDRVEILEWMKKNNMNDLDMIGFLVKMFYADSGKLKKLAKQNAPYDTISKMMAEEKEVEKPKQ